MRHLRSSASWCALFVVSWNLGCHLGSPLEQAPDPLEGLGTGGTGQPAVELTLTLMHVNDTHSQLEELSGQRIKINDTATYLDIAGMSRMSTKVAEVRAAKANTLLLHAGDAVQGTLYFTLYGGAVELDFLNAMAFDAMAIGNHELDKGAGALTDLSDQADFPLLSANADAGADPELAGAIQPYTVVTKAGQAIGIIGLTTSDTNRISSPGEHLTFEDEITAAARAVTELEDQGVQIIIALTHMGYEKDKALGQALSGIDVIVGGHSHTAVGGSALADLGVPVAGSYPTVVQNPKGESVLIVQAWERAKVLGVLDVTFDAHGNVMHATGQPVILADDNFRQIDDAGNKVEVDAAARDAIRQIIEANRSIELVAEDPEALDRLAPYKAGVEEMQSRVIADAGDDLWHTRVPFTDPYGAGVPLPFGSYIAPHVADAMLWKVNQNGAKNARLALKGGGGIQRHIPAGEISVGTALELLPFSNTLAVVELTGAEVLAAVQSGVTTATVGGSSGAFPYLSGARYTVDATTDPENPVVTRIEAKNDEGHYEVIDEARAYNMVVDSFVAAGGDSYEVIANATGPRYDTGFVDVEAFMDYAWELEMIYRPVEPAVTYETASKVIRVIETTDIHGALFPYDFIEGQTADRSLAHIVGYAEQQRLVANQSVLLLDGGDILQGQPLLNYYNYEHPDLAQHVVAAAMNYAGYDAAAVGNHDIEPGKPVYDAVRAAFDFPWLAANCIDTNTGTPYFEPYKMLDKHGVKIAVLGLVTPGIPMWLPQSVWPDMEFVDMKATAEKWVAKIEADENPDLIIGLFHSGWDFCHNHECSNQREIEAAYAFERNENGAQVVAREVDGFDLIAIGHDHRNYADTVVNHAGQTVYFMGADDSAVAIAEAIIVKHPDGTKEVEVLTRDVRRFPVDTAMVAAFNAQLDAALTYVDKEIGIFTEATSSRDAMFGDSSFNDLIHSLQLKVAEDVVGITADVSFAAPLQFDKTIEAGPIYVRDLYKLYKYDNWLYVMTLTGAQIDGHLEYSYAKWTNQMTSPDDHLINFTSLDLTVDPPEYTLATRYYNYDSAAGLVYDVDVTKPAYERVEILGLDADLDGEVDSEGAWDETRLYTVSINSYRATGGGGHLTDPKGANIERAALEGLVIGKTARDLRYYLGEEIESHGTVTPAALGNWGFVPEDWAAAGAARDREILYAEPDGGH